MVTKSLFKKYRTAEDYARAPLHTLEKEIGSITFFRSKSRYLKGIGEILLRDFGGVVPKTRDELMTLPGVAFKSANLIMAKVHGQFTGVAVDTHVKRVAPRLGLTKHREDTQKIAADLEKLYAPKDWLDVNEYFIMHGRAICKPGRPLCEQCPLQKICPTGKKIVGRPIAKRAVRG
jgi:endonuclease-3